MLIALRMSESTVFTRRRGPTDASRCLSFVALADKLFFGARRVSIEFGCKTYQGGEKIHPHMPLSAPWMCEDKALTLVETIARSCAKVCVNSVDYFVLVAQIQPCPDLASSQFGGVEDSWTYV